MGRGRQKAKQTKVARDLKYYSPPTDLSALQRELHSANEYDPQDADSDGDETEVDGAHGFSAPTPRRR